MYRFLMYHFSFNLVYEFDVESTTKKVIYFIYSLSNKASEVRLEKYKKKILLLFENDLIIFRLFINCCCYPSVSWQTR